MKLSHPETTSTQEIDETLALLSRVQPRDGLEQRVLARIAAAPALPWYRRFVITPAVQHRWMLAAASTVIVAGGVAFSVSRDHAMAPAPIPMALHAPRASQQPAAAAAAVAVPSHSLQSTTGRTHHRGIHRSYRATRATPDRVPLPRGTIAPRFPASAQ